MARTTAKDTNVDTSSVVTPVQNDVTGVQNDVTGVATDNGDNTGKHDGAYKVISKRFAGKAVYGPAGLVVFNQDGVANISDVEAQHFSKIPGFEVKQ